MRLHPLFIIVGIYYVCTGAPFLFFGSCIVALQHEYAHAFAASKLGYKLRKIVLMPFGAVLDSDIADASVADEVRIALAGPLCNLVTAGLFGALWWFFPDTYAFTDTAFYTSLSIALINLLPAYPLDGGRVLRCLLLSAHIDEKRVTRACIAVTVGFALLFFLLFFLFLMQGRVNISLALFGAFLALGAFGNGDKGATYQKIDFSLPDALARGVELKRVAVLESMPIKNAFRYIERGTYLVLEAHSAEGEKRFELAQNELSEWFLQAPTPYVSIGELCQIVKKSTKNTQKPVKILAKS